MWLLLLSDNQREKKTYNINKIITKITNKE